MCICMYVYIYIYICVYIYIYIYIYTCRDLVRGRSSPSRRESARVKPPNSYCVHLPCTANLPTNIIPTKIA